MEAELSPSEGSKELEVKEDKASQEVSLTRAGNGRRSTF